MHVGMEASKTNQMKGTEVPNPRRSSACDCTCVLIRNRTLSHDSLMLGMRILFCSCLRKVRSRVSDTLSKTLCNLSLAFLADFTLSHSMAPIAKLFSLANYTLLFVYSVHIFRLTGTAALHCGHTFVGGILIANGQ